MIWCSSPNLVTHAVFARDLTFVALHPVRPQGKDNEAVALLERAFSIFGQKMGENHRYTVDTRISLERVLKRVREQETNRAPR